MSTATATATTARRLEDKASDQEGAELVVHASSPLERLRLELDGAPLPMLARPYQNRSSEHFR
jgi:hypothetical protein